MQSLALEVHRRRGQGRRQGPAFNLRRLECAGNCVGQGVALIAQRNNWEGSATGKGQGGKVVDKGQQLARRAWAAANCEGCHHEAGAVTVCWAVEACAPACSRLYCYSSLRGYGPGGRMQCSGRSMQEAFRMGCKFPHSVVQEKENSKVASS
eukprot:scaffold79970_cov19-Tisochrysis_lutea.AAC.1